MFDKAKADHAVNFINCLKHTKGRWRGVPFELLPWQDEIIRTLYGTVKENGYRQYNTCYCEIPKKNGKSELAAAIALYMTCGDGEWGAEVYGCASDRQQASIVFDVAVDMVDQCPALKKRIKPVMSVKRLVYKPTNSFYQVLSAEAYTKHGLNVHADVMNANRQKADFFVDAVDVLTVQHVGVFGVVAGQVALIVGTDQALAVQKARAAVHGQIVKGGQVVKAQRPVAVFINKAQDRVLGVGRAAHLHMGAVAPDVGQPLGVEGILVVAHNVQAAQVLVAGQRAPLLGKQVKISFLAGGQLLAGHPAGIQVDVAGLGAVPLAGPEGNRRLLLRAAGHHR